MGTAVKRGESLSLGPPSWPFLSLALPLFLGPSYSLALRDVDTAGEDGRKYRRPWDRIEGRGEQGGGWNVEMINIVEKEHIPYCTLHTVLL